MQQYRLGTISHKAALQSGTWGSWWSIVWTWARNMPLRAITILGCVMKSAAKSRWTEATLPLYWFWWSHTWSAGSSSELTSNSMTWMHWSRSNKRPRGQLRPGPSDIGKSWESYDCSAQRILRGDPVNVYKYLTGRLENWVRLFSVIPSEKTRCKGHELKDRKFHFNILWRW